MSSIVELKISQDAVRKYAADLRNVEKKLDLAVDIILSLKEYISTITVRSIPCMPAYILNFNES